MTVNAMIVKQLINREKKKTITGIRLQGIQVDKKIRFIHSII